jgi:hypothetical protein
LAIEISDAGYPSDCSKRKPPRRAAGGCGINSDALFRQTKYRAVLAAAFACAHHRPAVGADSQRAEVSRLAPANNLS